MAALLLIFILLLSATLLRLQGEFEAKSLIAENYQDLQQALYQELLAEFSEELDTWGASLDSATLSVRFNEPEVLFEVNQAEIRPRFQNILADFFPRYIGVMFDAKYQNQIEEIRIEGHTDSDGDYIYNMRLSQDRTRSVLNYALAQLPSEEQRQWCVQYVTANGLSNSKPILDAQGREDKAASRRVEFRVKTNAEAQLQQMIDYARDAQP